MSNLRRRLQKLERQIQTDSVGGSRTHPSSCVVFRLHCNVYNKKSMMILNWSTLLLGALASCLFCQDRPLASVWNGFMRTHGRRVAKPSPNRGAEILAYILKHKGFPAGRQRPASPDALRSVRFKAAKACN